VVTTTKNKQLRQQLVVTLVLQAQVATRAHGLLQLIMVKAAQATVVLHQQFLALAATPVLACLQQAVTVVPHKVVATEPYLRLNRIEPTVIKARLHGGSFSSGVKPKM
jgi:hypothetical protein